jgi:MFS family permease
MAQFTRDRAASGPAQRPGLPSAAAFWLVAGAWFLLTFAAAAPSPLYDVYQAQWRFSAITLTAVFGVYALGLLIALLVFGSVSDYLGRRRVISVAMAAGAGACGLFLAAHGVGLLFAARALTGAAVGIASSAAGAALIDLQPQDSERGPVVTGTANLLGLAVGGLGTSALVQYGPAPTHLIWWLLLGAFTIGAVAVLAIPETAAGRPGVLASLRPRMAVPRQARATFAVALPYLIAAPALNGFYLALGPSLAAQVVGSRDPLWGGLVIFLVTGIAAVATVALRGISGPAATLAGCLALLSGAVMTLAGDGLELADLLIPGGRIASTVGLPPGRLGGRAVQATTVSAAPDRRTLERLADDVVRGQLTVPVQRTYPLADVPRALADFAAGTRGKLGIWVA